MALVDAEQAERALRRHGAGHRDLGRVRGQHHGRASRRSAGTAAFIGRRRRRPARRCVRPRHPRGRRALRQSARRRRPADRPLPRSWSRPDAERTLNTFLGPRRSSAPRTCRRPRRGRGGHLPRGLPLGPAARRRRRSGSPRRLAHQAGQRVALTLSDGFCVDRHRADFLDAGRRPGRHPVRQRSRDSARSTRSTTSTPRCSG